ncbi:HlyD family efflux transporter periplasmic adaptor subunit [Sinorhizobium sp. NFACC03]|uniref:HlyD family secretion protein n=1 Tax=Sinorhizobium sp. NFACC03 TaxID=1566295 RepID=UPI0015A029FF|nr:HlyD family efflux transporter periplasmic adaptor subunit [Sinorhizobium sp. NFACC03]
MEPTALFRPESFNARDLSWLGRPTNDQGRLSLAAVSMVALMFVAFAVLLMIYAQYTRRVKVAGVVLPVGGVTRLVAPQAGWVKSLDVHERQSVRKGEVLYTLSIDSTTSLGNTQDAIVGLLRNKRSELNAATLRQAAADAMSKKALGDRISSVEKEMSQVETQIALLENFTDTMRSFAERQQHLVTSGVSISREYEARLLAYNQQRTQLEALRRDRLQLAGRLSEHRNELLGFDLEASERVASIRRQILDIDQQISESQARQELQITAPRDGAITSIITQTGQTVGAGTPLLTIVPDDHPLTIQLLAPTNAIGFVREGDPVLLRYEAFPYQKFGQYRGRVVLISRTTLHPNEATEFNTDGAIASKPQSAYRITVEPEKAFVIAYGKKEPLQAGMQVQAHILAESRPLYQWLLQPIYSLRGSIVAPTDRP